MGTLPAHPVEVEGPPAGRSEDDEVEYHWVWLLERDEADQ